MMETFDPMSALQPGAVSASDDGMGLSAGQPMPMERFDQEMPFDEYTL